MVERSTTIGSRIASVVVFGITVLALVAWLEQRQARSDAHHDLVQRAEAAATYAAPVIGESATDVAEALADPEVVADHQAACRFLPLHSGGQPFAVVARDGSVLCGTEGIDEATWIDLIGRHPYAAQMAADPNSGDPSILHTVTTATFSAAWISPIGDLLAGLDRRLEDGAQVTIEVTEGGVVVDRINGSASVDDLSPAPADRQTVAGAEALLTNHAHDDADTAPFVFVDSEVPGTPWVVHIGFPASIIDDAVAETNQDTLVGFLTASAVLLLMALVAARSVAGPLVRADRNLRNTRVDHAPRLPVEGPREMRVLAAGINALADAQESSTARLRFLADHDELTGLANRRLLRERLEEVLSSPSIIHAALVQVDIHDFSSINQSYGAETGDHLLAVTAQRLRALEEPGLLLAREGSDQFIALRWPSSGPLDAELLAEQLAVTIGQPIEVEDFDVQLRVVVGATITTHGMAAHDAFREASSALEDAKRRGPGNVVVYDTATRSRVVERARMIRDLREALDSGAVHPAFQPQVAARSGRLVGAEALARWTHPTTGPVSPGEFIPVAERSGLIVEVGSIVLRRAVEAAAAWSAGPMSAAPRISVNLSARELALIDLRYRVESALTDSGLEAHRLTLEVTESDLLHDVDEAIGRLEQLRSLGCTIALDDYGTGYSSLSYLERLPLDELKLDRAFISNIVNSERATSIVGATIDLAHRLGLTVVCEGIETPDQAAAVTALDADIIQGFLYGRPGPASEIAAMAVDGIPTHPAAGT